MVDEITEEMRENISGEVIGNLTAAQRFDRMNDIRVAKGQTPHAAKSFPKESDLPPEMHRPTFNESQIAAMRSDYVRLGLDVAAFDRACRRDGTPVTPPPSAATKAAFDEAGLPHDPRPQDYTPDLGSLRQSLPPEEFSNVLSGTAQWAAELGMSRELGTAIIETMAQVGGQVSKMDADAKAKWVEAQERIGVRIAGSKASYALMIQKALTVISRASKTLDFSSKLKAGTAFQSTQILSLLATHHDQLALLKKAQTE